MARRSKKRSSSARSEKMDRVSEIGKNGRTLFDGPKPIMGYTANGRRILILLITR
jgi:hypothetical protein